MPFVKKVNEDYALQNTVLLPHIAHHMLYMNMYICYIPCLVDFKC